MLKVWKVEGDKERKTETKNIAYGRVVFNSVNVSLLKYFEY